MRKRNTLAAVAALLSFLVVGCGSSATSTGSPAGQGSQGTVRPQVSIRLGGIGPFSVTDWPIVVAKKQGFFAAEGISVNDLATFDGAQLLAGGKIDILNDGADSGLLDVQSGKDVIAFAPLMNRLTDGLLVRSSITKVSELAGKTLRTSGAGATDEFVLKNYLRSAGVDVSTVSFQPVEDDGPALAQIEAGAISGGMFDQGLLLQASRGQLKGVRSLVSPPDMGTYPWNTLQTTRSYAQAHPEVMVGFIRAVEKAITFIKDPANKSAVIDAAMNSDKSLSRQDLTDTYEAASGNGWPYATQPLSESDIQPAIDYVKSTNSGHLNIQAKDFIDNSYFEKATGRSSH